MLSCSAKGQNLKKEKEMVPFSPSEEEEEEEHLPSAPRPRQTGPPPIDHRIYPIALSSFLIGTSISMILPLMPVFCREIGISSGGYGVIVGAMGLSRLIANLPAGWLAEKVGRRPLLIAGPLITATGMLGMGFSASFPSFLAFRILSGVGGSFDMTAGQLYLSDISTPENRARVFAPSVMAFSAGSVVGPAIGGWLAATYSMQMPFILVSGGIACVAINNYLLLPETRTSNQYMHPTKLSLRRQLSDMVSQWRPLLRQQDIRSALALHGTYWFVSSSCIYTTLPLLGSEVLQLGMSEIATWYVIMSLISILGTRFSAHLSDHRGRKFALVPSAAIMSASLALFPLASAYSHVTSLVVLWGIGGALFGANTTAYISDKSTEGTRSQALTLLRSCADGGLMLGGAFSGMMSYFFSMDAPFMVGSFLMASAGLHFCFRAAESNIYATRRRKSKKSPPPAIPPRDN